MLITMRDLLIQPSVIIKDPLGESELTSPFSNLQEEEFFSLAIESRLTIEEEKNWYSFCQRLNANLFGNFQNYDEKKQNMMNLVISLFFFLLTIQKK